MASAKGRSCIQCEACFTQDTGYSNYTVEGTNFTCLKGAHPKGTFDQFYEEAPELKYAQECPLFVPGERIEIDVDGGNWDGLNPAQIKLLLEYPLVRLLTGSPEIDIPEDRVKQWKTESIS